MSIPPKLSNEWLVRLLFSACSIIGTGGSMYALQWWLIIKDAATRTELNTAMEKSDADRKAEIKALREERKQEIADAKSAFIESLDRVASTIEKLDKGQEQIKTSLNNWALATTELQTLIKKDSRS